MIIDIKAKMRKAESTEGSEPKRVNAAATTAEGGRSDRQRESIFKTATNAIFLGDKQENEEQRPFKARFLQAGLVKYDYGVCLLKKETIDKFINTFIDCPVIIDHKDNLTEDDREGTIKNIWFSPEDGWFWCDGFLSDEAADLVKNGYNISCQYKITEYANNYEHKLHNGNEYDKEILNGIFEHLAIVKTPRYEDAYIAVNAILASNEDKWITIGADEDTKGRHVLVKDGQTKKQAIQEKIGEWNRKSEKENNKEYTWKDKKYSLRDLIDEGFEPIEYTGSIYKDDNQRKYIEKTEGKKYYRLPVSDEEFKKVKELKEQRKNKKLEQDKNQSKDLADYVKWQYNQDITPFITGKIKDKILVNWDKMPRNMQSALKRLDFDNKINLDMYSGWEMGITVKDNKIFDVLKKHKDNVAINSFTADFTNYAYNMLIEGLNDCLGEFLATNWTKENFKESDVLRDKGKFAKRSEFSKETKNFTELEKNYAQYFEKEPENYTIHTEDEALKNLKILKNKPKEVKTPIGKRNVSYETIHHIYTRSDKTRYKSINKMFATLERPLIINKYKNKEYFFKIFKTDEYKNDIAIVSPEENNFEVITNIPTDTLNWFYKKMQFGETIYDTKKAATDKNQPANNSITNLI